MRHGVESGLHVDVVAVSYTVDDVTHEHGGTGTITTGHPGVVEVALLTELYGLAVGGVRHVGDDHLGGVALVGPVVEHAELNGLRSNALGG